MLNLKRREDCCGCNACGDICPRGAISYPRDEEGIWYPQIDRERCIDCGLCEKVCPIIHIDDLKHNDKPQADCYAVEHKNLETVFDSTSGGAFSALADIMYRRGGYVGGAVFDEHMLVRQFISNNKDDLPRLRSSKYLQSNAEGFYREVKKLLDDGQEVLVCGTPCQMAALRAFLGKDYPKLIIADFICLGMNSPKVWQKYLQSYEERYGSPVVWAKAKSKEYGWRNLTQKVKLADGREFFETKDTSAFTQGYIGTHLYCRSSCYECQFKGMPRMADITLADYWGIEKYNHDMEKNLGTSLVMVNSEKGAQYFEQVKQRINFIPMPYETIFAGNRALTRSITRTNNDRAGFFHDLDVMPFQEVIKKYSRPSQLTWKQRLRRLIKPTYNEARYVWHILRFTRMHPRALYQTVRYSGLGNLLHHRGIICGTHCTLEIARSARLEFENLLFLGAKGRFPTSDLETRLLVAEGGVLTIHGETSIGYGSDIEVHEGGHLIFHGRKYLPISGTNIAATIICAQKIEVMPDVEMGRNVLIRDNNGAHYMNRRSYRNSRDVLIGEKAWLCESCTILPGVKVGKGAIVGAKSVVVRSVPDHAMVFGTPAEIVDEDVLWKY